MDKKIEEFWPWAFGTIAFALFAWAGPKCLSFAASNEWDVSELYVAVFDVNGLLAGFLFAFFTFVRAADTKFISSIKKTRTFKAFLSFLKTAILLCAGMTLVTVPYMVAEPVSSDRASIEFWAI